MRFQILLVAFVVSVMGFAAPCVAQRGGHGVAMDGDAPLTVHSMGVGTAGNNYKDYAYGVVKTLSKDEIVLTKTNAGVDQTFKFNNRTKFIRDGKKSSPESLKLGDQVWVDAKEDKKTGELIARKVISGAFLM